MSRPRKSSAALFISTPASAQLDLATIRRWVNQARQKLGVQTRSLSIATVSSQRSRQLNRRYRQRDYATNVLSFSFAADKPRNPEKVWGEIVLCPTVIRRQARQWPRTYRQHFRVLLEHGLIHLLGYDHRTVSEQRRWNKIEQQLHPRD